ncbi:MAG: hypothetical protein WKF70_05875 [Chitinophagaceae bacterium]
MSNNNKKEFEEEGKIIESPIIRDRENDISTDRSSGEGTPLYLTSDTTLQSPEEHAHDQSVDAREDETLEVSNDDKSSLISDDAGADDVEDNQNND